MALTELLHKNLQFILFGGKGGVGKTTMAVASAIMYAKKNPKKRVLIFTTDPAPSLSDSLAQKLSHEPRLVKGFKNLWAMEIDPKKELENLKKEYGDDILDILQQGTYLSDEETKDVLSLDLPGLDEIIGLKKVTDFMNSSNYDVYVLDTAPTGHTLRLLTLPNLLDNWIQFLSRLRWKYHYMVDRLSRGTVQAHERADEFLLEMKRTVKRVQGVLRDVEKTTFVVVTIPEAMGVEETKDLIESLLKVPIPVEHIIINNIIPLFTPAGGTTDTSKELEFLQKRRSVQDFYIHDIQEAFPTFTITEVPLEPHEVRGVEALTHMGEKLYT
jgi:arsenite/tail-anchored protein-transporting ATPase